MEKKYLGFCLVIVSLLTISFFTLHHFAPSPPQTNDTDLTTHPDNHLPTQEDNSTLGPSAALVDSLYLSSPNQDFTSKLNKTLIQAGFTVDVYQGEEVTVDFLKSLPEDYDLLLLRMHSAVHSESLGLYLFTAESYVQDRYVEEQYHRLVKKATAYDESRPVFAVNWMFIQECMTGKFNGTLVVVMGCDGAQDPLITWEFFEQGAKGYVAWDGAVLPSHSDRATLQLIQNLYIQNLTLPQAVQKTNQQVGPDPHQNATLTFTLPH